jgi:hypothetical protein
MNYQQQQLLNSLSEQLRELTARMEATEKALAELKGNND